MPVTGVATIQTVSIGAGTTVLPARILQSGTGRLALALLVSRSPAIPDTWFKAGRVTWDLVLSSGVTYGIRTDELWFGEQIAYFPPDSLIGNNVRPRITLREFMPLVTVNYSQYTG